MASLRKALNNKCRECIYDPKGCAGTWRQQVEACTAPSCPLYPVRPISKPRKRVWVEEARAISETRWDAS